MVRLLANDCAWQGHVTTAGRSRTCVCCSCPADPPLLLVRAAGLAPACQREFLQRTYRFVCRWPVGHVQSTVATPLASRRPPVRRCTLSLAGVRTARRDRPVEQPEDARTRTRHTQTRNTCTDSHARTHGGLPAAGVQSSPANSKSSAPGEFEQRTMSMARRTNREDYGASADGKSSYR
jgi:hypothetical protein